MRRLILCSLALLACRKTPAPKPAASAEAAQMVENAVKEQALRDIQNDIILLKAQLAALVPLSQKVSVTVQVTHVNTALYLCDRIAVAGRELAGEARAQAILGEADGLCAYQVPLAAGQHKLAALESTRDPADPPPKSAPTDCGPIRDALARVGAKYKNDAQLAEIIKRFKTDCPRMRLASNSVRSEPAHFSPTVDLSAQRDACRKRCDDAAFHCRASCQYCGSCTSDKTWEWCNQTCNNCRQGCEQNEKFCQASCGGS